MKICCLCKAPITDGQPVERHHPIYKSRGGQQTAPTHKTCHRNFHRDNGDFKMWGRLGGLSSTLTRRWAFNLKHVRDNPQFAIERGFYLALYAKGGVQ